VESIEKENGFVKNRENEVEDLVQNFRLGPEDISGTIMKQCIDLQIIYRSFVLIKRKKFVTK